MTNISIFSIKLGQLLLSCQRDSANSYELISQTFRAPLSFSAAEALADGARRIMARWRKAVQGRMTPGLIFGLQLPDSTVAIGATDDGRDIYCEVGDEHVRMNEDELHGLMFALGRLRDDVAAVQRQAAAGPLIPDFGVARGMRAAWDARLPPWAREFE
jgi:hypothetical protein